MNSNTNQETVLKREIENSNLPISLPCEIEEPDNVFEEETPLLKSQSYFRVDVPSAFDDSKNEITFWEFSQSILFNLIQYIYSIKF